MKCLIVIPARGGSKRIPQKNIALLNQKPLLVYTIDCVKEAKLQDISFVSTENEIIEKISKDNGLKVIKRPISIATDSASTEAVLLDAIKQYTNLGYEVPDWVMTLPPTSPLRKSKTLIAFMELLESVQNNIDCIMSVTENRGDFWHYNEHGEFKRLMPNASRRQQERAPLFEENSAIYLTRVSALMSTNSILGSSVLPVPIDTVESVDINTIDDLCLAEYLLSKVSSKS